LFSTVRHGAAWARASPMLMAQPRLQLYAWTSSLQRCVKKARALPVYAGVAAPARRGLAAPLACEPVVSAGLAGMRAAPCQGLLARLPRLNTSFAAADSLQVRTAAFTNRKQPRACSSCAWDPLRVTGASTKRSSSRSGARWKRTWLPGCGGRSDGPVCSLLCCCHA